MKNTQQEKREAGIVALEAFLALPASERNPKNPHAKGTLLWQLFDDCAACRRDLLFTQGMLKTISNGEAEKKLKLDAVIATYRNTLHAAKDIKS